MSLNVANTRVSAVVDINFSFIFIVHTIVKFSYFSCVLRITAVEIPTLQPYLSEIDCWDKFRRSIELWTRMDHLPKPPGSAATSYTPKIQDIVRLWRGGVGRRDEACILSLKRDEKIKASFLWRLNSQISGEDLAKWTPVQKAKSAANHTHKIKAPLHPLSLSTFRAHIISVPLDTQKASLNNTNIKFRRL